MKAKPIPIADTIPRSFIAGILLIDKDAKPTISVMLLRKHGAKTFLTVEEIAFFALLEAHSFRYSDKRWMLYAIESIMIKGGMIVVKLFIEPLSK